jgi:hypothetical protein
MPVAIARPLAGHLIMTMPMFIPPWIFVPSARRRPGWSALFWGTLLQPVRPLQSFE